MIVNNFRLKIGKLKLFRKNVSKYMLGMEKTFSHVLEVRNYVSSVHEEN